MGSLKAALLEKRVRHCGRRPQTKCFLFWFLIGSCVLSPERISDGQFIYSQCVAKASRLQVGVWGLEVFARHGFCDCDRDRSQPVATVCNCLQPFATVCNRHQLMATFRGVASHSPCRWGKLLQGTFHGWTMCHFVSFKRM